MSQSNCAGKNPVLSLVAFFFIGGGILMTVNGEKGRRIAREEDARLLQPEMSA